MQNAPRPPWLALTALALFAALLLVPPTRWLVRLQVAAQFAPPVSMTSQLRELGIKEGLPEENPGETQRHAAERMGLARQQPNNYAAQLIAAITPPPDPGPDNSWPKERMRRLREVALHYPENPAHRAHALRFATMGEVRVRRKEEYLLTGATLPTYASAFQPPSEDELAAFDRDAEAGERLDSDNAFFPFMRAIGLFAAGRDGEALQQLHRAAEKPRFDDYVSDEARAHLAVSEALYGRSTVLRQVMTSASILFPHYAALRGAARMATYKAVEAEAAGNRETGTAIRRDLLRLGSKMRVQSTSLIGSLVGIAIGQVATARPGGIPADQPNTTVTADAAKRVEAQVHRLRYYLNHIGKPDEARWLLAEFAEGQEAKDIAKQGIKRGVFSGEALGALISWWILDLLTLANALRLLLLCLAAALLARFRKTEGLQPVGVIFGLLLLTALFAPQTEWISGFSQMRTVLTSLTTDGGPEAQGGAGRFLHGFQIPPGVLRMIAYVFSFAVPVTLLLGLGLVGLTRREPFSAVLVRGLSGVGAALACALLLAYWGMAQVTAREEIRLSNELQQMLRHEGRYYAGLVGRSWPGQER